VSQIHGLREIGYVDCPGSGQVYVDQGHAYLAHMEGPDGTTVVDVKDPRRPRRVAALQVPDGVHSHKVRVANDVMLVNWEAPPPYTLGPGFRGGLGIYDVSNPASPRQITFWQTAGTGVHRYDFDGRYAYISPEVDGYVGNIVMILDLTDPAKPEEVGRWWMPGQWTAGGETPTWGYRETWCHHPLRMGNRLHVGYWHAGFVILDIEDMRKPRLVSHLDWSPPYAHPTHTALPIPFPVSGRRLLVVTDEDVRKLHPSPPPFMWIVDITEETRPIPLSTFQVPGVDDTPQPEFTGCHQPAEQIYNTEIPVAWFANGLRIVDIKNPHAPQEVARFVPDAPSGFERPSTNDVFQSAEGLLYVVDRQRGLHILERV